MGDLLRLGRCIICEATIVVPARPTVPIFVEWRIGYRVHLCEACRERATSIALAPVTPASGGGR